MNHVVNDSKLRRKTAAGRTHPDLTRRDREYEVTAPLLGIPLREILQRRLQEAQ